VFELYIGCCVVLVINVVEMLFIVLGVCYVVDNGMVCILCYSRWLKVCLYW